MADNPLNSNPVQVLAEEVSQRDGAAISPTAYGQLVILAAQVADGQVVTFDPRVLATSAKQDLAKAVLDTLATNTANGSKTADVQAVRDRLPSSLIASALPTIDGGTYGYAAGTATATVDVPAGARVKRVSVLAGSGGSATVTIAGGNTITIPANTYFDEQIPGLAALGGDVVIGGSVNTYYVSWVS